MIFENLEQSIRTSNLVLEPIIVDHAESLFKVLKSEKLYEFIPLDPPKSVDVLKEKFTRWVKRGSIDGSEIWLNYAVFMPSHNNYVGTLQATIVDNGISYIAYDVVPEMWRKGIGKEACVGMIDFIYKSFPTVKIGALVDTRNDRSWKLLESLGFIREKKIENADFFKGATSDEYLYLLDRKKFNLLHLED